MSFSLGSGNLSVAEPNPTKNNSSHVRGRRKVKESDNTTSLLLSFCTR